jgi:hypothetical protein
VSFLAGLLRAVFLLFLVRLVVRFLASLARPRSEARPGSATPHGAGELVRDRICNTFMPRERSIAARVDGREERFCSPACRDRALAAVSRAS